MTIFWVISNFGPVSLSGRWQFPPLPTVICHLSCSVRQTNRSFTFEQIYCMHRIEENKNEVVTDHNCVGFNFNHDRIALPALISRHMYTDYFITLFSVSVIWQKCRQWSVTPWLLFCNFVFANFILPVITYTDFFFFVSLNFRHPRLCFPTPMYDVTPVFRKKIIEMCTKQSHFLIRNKFLFSWAHIQ